MQYLHFEPCFSLMSCIQIYNTLGCLLCETILYVR